MERVPLGTEDAAMVGMLGDDAAVSMLAVLPADQRSAIHSYVVDEYDYGVIAAAEGVSEPAVRQRVSRGLATLRRLLGGEP